LPALFRVDASPLEAGRVGVTMFFVLSGSGITGAAYATLIRAESLAFMRPLDARLTRSTVQPQNEAGDGKKQKHCSLRTRW
jgi:peptidoglycan/LPS O-acetylase OafA/YrhL